MAQRPFLARLGLKTDGYVQAGTAVQAAVTALGASPLELAYDVPSLTLKIGSGITVPNVGGVGSLAIGNAISSYSPAAGTPNLLIGRSISTSANFNNTVLIGMSMALGASSHANAIILTNGGTIGSVNDGVVIGRPDSTGANCTLIGRQASGGQDSVAVGRQASATATGGTALGRSASTGGFTNSTAIGNGATCLAANQVTLGRTTEHVSIPGTGVASSTTTGALRVAGGIGIAGTSYIAGTITDSNSFHVSTGTVNTTSAGVHIDRASANSAGSTGGIALTQQDDDNRRLFLTGNDGTFSFNVGSYVTSTGILQFGTNMVGITTLVIGSSGARAVGSGSTQVGAAMTARVGSSLALTAAADTNGKDTYFTTETGGAHTSNNPRGGDFIIVPGSAGAGGAGRAGQFKVQGNAYITGKLTVDGLIDPTGLALTPVAANPGGVLGASTLWVNSGDSNKLYFGAAEVGGGGSTSPGGDDTNIQFNDGGAFGGADTFTYNGQTCTTVIDASNETSGDNIANSIAVALTGVSSPDAIGIDINATSSTGSAYGLRVSASGSSPAASIAAELSGHVYVLNGGILFVDTTVVGPHPDSGYSAFVASGLSTAMSGAAQNVGVGARVFMALTSGSNNVAVGYESLKLVEDGYSNIAIGSFAGMSVVSGISNVFIGTYAGTVNTGNGSVIIGDGTGQTLSSGQSVVLIGAAAGMSLTTGSGNVHIGYNAGYYETEGDKLYIDNRYRVNEATERLTALVYGVFADAVADQRFTVNGILGFQYGLSQRDSNGYELVKVDNYGHVQFAPGSTTDLTVSDSNVVEVVWDTAPSGGFSVARGVVVNIQNSDTGNYTHTVEAGSFIANAYAGVGGNGVIGVYAQAEVASDATYESDAFAFKASAYNPSAGDVYGIDASVYADGGGLAVGGTFTGYNSAAAGIGVKASGIIDENDLYAYGVYATAEGFESGSGQVAIGIYATAEEAETNWAGWFDGAVKFNGAQSIAFDASIATGIQNIQRNVTAIVLTNSGTVPMLWIAGPGDMIAIKNESGSSIDIYGSMLGSHPSGYQPIDGSASYTLADGESVTLIYTGANKNSGQWTVF
jgi:hypothetical protein